MSFRSRYVSVDIDATDVLNELDEDEIIDYCQEHGISISVEDETNDDFSEKDLVNLIEQFMNKGITNIPRNKQEMKKYICDLIDFYKYF